MLEQRRLVYKLSPGYCKKNTIDSIFCCGEDPTHVTEEKDKEKKHAKKLQLAKVNIRLQSE